MSMKSIETAIHSQFGTSIQHLETGLDEIDREPGLQASDQKEPLEDTENLDKLFSIKSNALLVMHSRLMQ